MIPSPALQERISELFIWFQCVLVSLEDSAAEPQRKQVMG